MSRHTHLYQNAVWRARRAQQLRQHPACKFCLELEQRQVPATVADHVTPHRGDRVLFAGPLQSLCATCHSSRKARLEAGRHMLGCDSEGIPLDSNHGWRIEVENERRIGGCSSPSKGADEKPAAANRLATSQQKPDR